jgi:hypothetical protein
MAFHVRFQLDPTFFDLPRIRLLEIPPELPNAVPHLEAEGGLCYPTRELSCWTSTIL